MRVCCLAGDLDVVALDQTECPHPQPRLHLEQRELLLGERPDPTGDEAALGEAAVQLGQESGLALVVTSMAVKEK